VPVDDIEPWMIWGYYMSPMTYGQNAIVINEFLDKRWSNVRCLHLLILELHLHLLHAYANISSNYAFLKIIQNFLSIAAQYRPQY
jgi:hypothetical protein